MGLTGGVSIPGTSQINSTESLQPVLETHFTDENIEGQRDELIDLELESLYLAKLRFEPALV